MLRSVKVENGLLRGLPGADPRITVFKGVPFAAPPVGPNRWRAPMPCPDWDGEREAYCFGPISLQDTPGLGDDIYCREWHVDPEIPMSEDCLYLNVWTPAKKTDEKLPVLVWYFGGGFQWGYTAEMEFDGERLARRGIVVVSVAYRLAAFGYLAHPEITAEAPDAPGNFGLLDQRAGLLWVHRNISAFGGDPDRITIAGQSAGGGSTMHQFVCDDDRDIIKGAAVISGMMRDSRDESSIFDPLPLAEAEKQGKRFFDHLGVSSLEEARAIDAKTLLQKYNEFVSEGEQRMFPILDGKFCTRNPIERIVDGDCADAPIMAGNTADEFFFDGVNNVETSVKSTFIDSDAAGSRQKHFYYRFDPDIPGWDRPGTFHSVDLWFFFETLAKCWRPFTGRHYDLARVMCDQFANFIKTGDPNGIGSDGDPLPVWKPYSKAEPNEMVYTGGGARSGIEGGIRLSPSGRKQAVNPYLPSWEYIPDGEPYVFDDRVYVYGSHDQYDGQVFCLGDYVCWSAPVNDLGNWRYEGVIYDKTNDPFNRDGRMCLYAPDVTKGTDGRYYLYYVLDKVSVVSVAVCDKPAGRYEFLGYVHYPDGTKLGDKPGDEPQFDPGVLTENGKTYLFTGFCGHGDKSRSGAMLTVLGSDMLTVEKVPVIIAPGSEYSAGTPYEGHAFFEAPSIRKKDGRYWFIYSSQVMHELCYAVSDSPEGPYEYAGVLVSNCDLHIDSYKDADKPSAGGANNHGSMVEIGGSWYIFYHRHTNGTWYSRQGCAERLSFNSDGMAIQAEMTSCGLNGSPLSDVGEYPAYIACNLFAPDQKIYVEPTKPMIRQEPGGEQTESYISGMTEGCVAGFKYFDMDGITGIAIKTRGYHDGKMEVRTSLTGEVLGTIDLKSTNVWVENECAFPPVFGVLPLYLTWTGSGSVSLLSFRFLH